MVITLTYFYELLPLFCTYFSFSLLASSSIVAVFLAEAGHVWVS